MAAALRRLRREDNSLFRSAPRVRDEVRALGVRAIAVETDVGVLEAVEGLERSAFRRNHTLRS
jgi:hypothetical protein